VTTTLQHAIAKDQVAHAFLFCGPRGVGKTTCARVLAKVLNCTGRGEELEPCNACPSCKSFNDQASFNIIELDGASNNKVENIRTLIDQVRIPPQEGKYKVFIIDEVHMLSASAFNAFLKTLEEPPSYAIFILATTEKHKLLPTILSRCQIFDFKRIDVPRIMDHLENICQQEGITADRDALHLIATKADGALRDALSIFDRVASFSGGDITYEKALENLRELDADYYFKSVDYFLLGDVASAITLLNDIVMLGFEPGSYLQGLSEHFRNLLFSRDEKTVELMQVSDAMKQRYLDQAKATPYAFILSALDTCSTADIDHHRASHKRLHVESVLCRLAYYSQRLTESSFSDALVQKSAPTEKKKNIIPDPKESSAPGPEKNHESLTANTQNAKTFLNKPGSDTDVVPKTPTQPSSLEVERSVDRMKVGRLSSLNAIMESVVESEQRVSDVPPFTHENVSAFWQKYADQVQSPSIQQILKNAQLAVESDERMTITVVGKVAQNSIQLEKELLSSIREHFQVKNLQYSYEVLEPAVIETAIEKPTHLMTASERYKKLVDKNPEIDNLRVAFDLKIDTQSRT